MIALDPQNEHDTPQGEMLGQHRARIIQLEKERLKSDTKYSIRIGKELAAVEVILKREQRFYQWVLDECGLCRTVAARYLRIFKTLGHLAPDLIDRFSQHALDEMSKATTSEESRAEAIAIAEAGERVTHSIAADLRWKHPLKKNKYVPRTSLRPNGDRRRKLVDPDGEPFDIDVRLEEIRSMICRMRDSVPTSKWKEISGKLHKLIDRQEMIPSAKDS